MTGQEHRLGIDKSAASRYRQAATFRLMLPKDPPPELYGKMWTLMAGLEFGKVKTEMLKEMDHDDVDAIANIDAKVVHRLKQKRHAPDLTALTKSVIALEQRISQALHHADPGAVMAIDTLQSAARRLGAAVRDFEKDADAHRDEDARLMKDDPTA